MFLRDKLSLTRRDHDDEDLDNDTRKTTVISLITRTVFPGEHFQQIPVTILKRRVSHGT